MNRQSGLNKSLKVLHVITSINRGGSENQLCELVFLQIKQGLIPTVAYLKGDSYWEGALKKSGVSVTSLGLKNYRDIKPIFKLSSLIRKLNPDIIHAHMPPAELYSRLALLLNHSKAELIITKHNDEPFYRGLGHAIMGRWVARRAAHIIAISHAVRSYTTKNLGIPNEKVTTINYGIESRGYNYIRTNNRVAVRAGWGITPEQYVIGTVGRIVPQKAQHVLIDAYARYCEVEQKDSRLVIVGRGILESRLKDQARKLGLERKVIWAGYREDIPAVMNAFDVFTLTSSHEGFGLVLVEAMVAQLPVVATRVSAIPEIIKDGLTGILCEEGQSQQIANAFFQLEDINLRQSLGSAGNIRVKLEYTSSRMAKKTLETYYNNIK